ncbi:MAG: GntR family transcriptional regulator [Intestinimonas sp.]
MEQYVTLFSRVYQDLKGRIVTGQFPSGGDFPSIQRLRQEYQIGFRTAKEVTVRLREDGHISLQEQKAAAGLLGGRHARRPCSAVPQGTAGGAV